MKSRGGVFFCFLQLVHPCACALALATAPVHTEGVFWLLLSMRLRLTLDLRMLFGPFKGEHFPPFPALQEESGALWYTK